MLEQFRQRGHERDFLQSSFYGVGTVTYVRTCIFLYIGMIYSLLPPPPPTHPKKAFSVFASKGSVTHSQCWQA